MAIKRMDPKAVFKIISGTDDALLHETPEELVTENLDADGARIILPTRYEQYVDEANFDESKLKFVEGKQPERFLLRSLTADELADINNKHIFVDSVAKKVTIINKNKMFLEMFRAAYLGIESEGKTVKVPTDEIPFGNQVEMGAVVSLIANLGKNLKK